MLVHKKIVLFFVLLTLQIVIAQSTRTNGVILPERGICAHRGAMETHPENTISAFKEAIRLGAHMIEFDVRMTKDGKLVIMHDKSVNRTTNGSGLVSDLTYDEIKKLDAGRWKSEMFKGERIPTLKETLQVMPHNIWLNIHLKEGYELGKATATVVVSENRIHQGVIACGTEAKNGVLSVSKDMLICNMERQSDRDQYVIETTGKDFKFIQLLKKRDNVHLQQDIYTLKNNNIKINYFYGDTEKEVKYLFEKGVDFVLTNKLSEMMKVAESMGIKRQLQSNLPNPKK